MPDWIAHIAIGYLLALICNKEKELVVLGALLPDIFKIFIPFAFLFGFGSESIINFFAPFHTVVGVLITAVLISTFFSSGLKVLPLLLLGATSHLLLDSLQYPFGYENWFLWPLYIGVKGFIWPDSMLPALISSSFCLLIALLKGEVKIGSNSFGHKRWT